jgi:hypothetical protein
MSPMTAIISLVIRADRDLEKIPGDVGLQAGWNRFLNASQESWRGLCAPVIFWAHI